MSIGPRITIGRRSRPRVTVGSVKPPSVTVGGDVGRAGQQAANIGRAVLRATVAPAKTVVDVVAGKPVDQAVKDAISAQLDPAIAVLDAAATAHQIVGDLRARLAPVIGDELDGLLEDLMRLTVPLPPETAAAAARAVQRFVETGTFSLLDPLAILIAGEIVRERNAYWNKAHPIASEVIAALPEEYRQRAGVCRTINRDDIPGNANFPTIAIKHLKRASAVCLVDLIVLGEHPDPNTDDGKHFWAHELTHADQYAAMGVVGFYREYLADLFSRKDLVDLERDADLAACAYFPQAHPRYIKVCPAPQAQPAAVSPTSAPATRTPAEPHEPSGTQGGAH